MLRISTKGRYGVRFMLELALQYGNGPVYLKQIAENQDISDNYLSQLIIPLKSAGLIIASRGAHGGYILAREPGAINLREIVEALEGPIAVVECVTAPIICKKSESCAARDVWSSASAKFAEYLQSTTLADLAKQEHDKHKKKFAGRKKQ